MITKFPLALSFDDVLLTPQYSDIESRNDVSLKTQITKDFYLDLPIISANMSDVTGVDMAIELGKLGGLGVIPRFKSAEEQASDIVKIKKHNLKVGAAIGVRGEMYDRVEMLLNAGADIFFLDVAHGHMQKVIDATVNFKNKFGDINLVAGNVATSDAAEALFKAGADALKVGVGPGSICTTRIMTGSGVPQLTAILESAKVARKYKKFLIADGGCKTSGDIVKALAAGASAVMLGNMLAGVDESPGVKTEIDGRWYKSYNASTSIAEKKSHLEHNKDFEKNYTKQIEGVESLVSYKGALHEIVDGYTANIRSGLSYSGAKNISDLWQKAKFVRLTSSALRENGAHDVFVK